MKTTFTPNEFFTASEVNRAKLQKKVNVLRTIKGMLQMEARVSEKQGDDVTTINEHVCTLKFNLLNQAGASNLELDTLESWAKAKNLI